MRQYCALDDAGPGVPSALLKAAIAQLQMTARAYHRTRSVKHARTNADLAAGDRIQTVHLAEAIHLRPRRQS